MKPMNPLESLSEVGGGNGSVQEQAQFHNSAYGRLDRPNHAQDATLNWSGGQHSVNPGGPGDTTNFPQDVAMVSGSHSAVDPNAADVANRPTPFDGFGDAGSGVDRITGRR